jgi:hypothetical protein
MATRKKVITQAQKNDLWKIVGSELVNGVQMAVWEHEDGHTKMIRNGLHPDDSYNLPAAAQSFTEQYEEVEPDIEETATDRVATLLQQAAGQERAELNVYRIVNGAREYCAKYLPEEFEEGTFELLRKNFGSGEYELRLYATHPESRKFVVRSSTRVKIAQSQNSSEPAALPNGLSQVLATIATGQQQMLNALVEMKQTPQKDPMEEMTKMLSMMTMMREAMGITNQRQEKSSIGEIVSAIKELKGAASELAPDKEREPDSLMAMLPKVLEMVSAGQQAQAQAIPMQIPSVQMPQSFEQPVPQNESIPENDVNIMTMVKLKSYLTSLTNLAEKNETIEVGAKFVYDNLPDDLIEIMELPNWFELLSGVAPAVKKHEEWLKKVRDSALKLFDDAESE